MLARPFRTIVPMEILVLLPGPTEEYGKFRFSVRNEISGGEKFCTNDTTRLQTKLDLSKGILTLGHAV